MLIVKQNYIAPFSSKEPNAMLCKCRAFYIYNAQYIVHNVHCTMCIPNVVRSLPMASVKRETLRVPNTFTQALIWILYYIYINFFLSQYIQKCWHTRRAPTVRQTMGFQFASNNSCTNNADWHNFVLQYYSTSKFIGTLYFILISNFCSLLLSFSA